MSDREFDNYLTLLAGLLQLDGKQRGAIAEELRSHLEDRLEELVGRGVSRDEAIKQALAEFGDAAGLAGQFVAISRNRKRRWLMRLTTFSVAAIVLLAAGLAIFWPGRNAAPGVAAVIAEQPQAEEPLTAPEPSDEKPAKVQRGNALLSAALRIEQELDKTTELDAVEMPLKDVVQYLMERHRIPIVLSSKKLDEASVSPDTPVTKSLRGMRLRSLLNLLLKDLELTYLVRDEVLQITTPEDAESTTEVRIYDCRDILTMPAAGQEKNQTDPAQHGERAEQLMNIITTNVFPETWQGSGGFGAARKHKGSGTISEYNGLIVVTQTSHGHTTIEHVLNMLREAAGLEGKVGRVVR